MIVDRLRSGERRAGVERSARVRWEGGESLLSVTVPPAFAAERLDGSPFLCATVLLAMRLGEDLDVDGPVSAALLEAAPRIVDLYARWDPRLHRSRVHGEPEPRRPLRAAGIGCFMSRGVDSLYSAASPRGLPGALTHLVFCDGLSPRHRADVRAEEVRLAGEAAARLGLPLVVAASNVRELTDPIVSDWEDMVGAGLAFLATSLAGGLGHLVIASSDGAASIGPCGTSPLLDPLFSIEELDIHHDAPGTRPAKIAWLARERRELLPHLEVCADDRADNCGRCSKCLLTLLALEAAGARHQATSFPPELDLEALAEVAPSALNARLEFAEVARALRERGAPQEVVAAVDALLHRADAIGPSAVSLKSTTPGFRGRASWEALTLAAGPPSPRPSGPEVRPPVEVARVRRELERSERRGERASRSAKAAQGRVKEMKVRRTSAERSRWWRLGMGLERVRGALVRGRGRR